MTTKTKILFAAGSAVVLSAVIFFGFTEKGKEIVKNISGKKGGTDHSGDDGASSEETPEIPVYTAEQQAKMAEWQKRANEANKGKTMEQIGGRPGAIKSADGWNSY